MFGPFPKSLRSFVPVVPPMPPNRKSSRTNSTLKLFSHLHTEARAKNSCARHDTLQARFAASKKVETDRSRSAGPLLTTSTLRDTVDNRARISKKISYRASSSSPINKRMLQEARKSSQSPVAFGRGISRERAFAEEKKKLEEKLSKIHRDLTVSTRILRNPELRSPNEVKKAMQNTFRPITQAKDPMTASLMFRKSLQEQAIQASNKSFRSDQKSVKVSMSMSASRSRDYSAPRARQASTLSSLSSRSTGFLRSVYDSKTKQKFRSKNSLTTNSNISLTRSNSTFSIDSSQSKKRNTETKFRTVPLTLTSSKLKKSLSKEKLKTKKRVVKKEPAFQDSQVDDNNKVVESINEAIVHQNEAIRSDSFFQKLFLKDNYKCHLKRNSSVLQKAKMWNSIACKSEPSLCRQSNRYLYLSRPVSNSKFLINDESSDQDTSYSVYEKVIREPIRGAVTEQVYKFDSLYNLSDEDEFGNTNRGRSMDFSYAFHERSKSEPPTTLLTEFIRPRSPHVIYGRYSSSDTEKRSRTSRSPSCRRIQSLKSNKLELSSYQNKLARARSVGRTDRAKEKLYSKSNLYRSKSLNIVNFEKHNPVCSHRRSDRFKDLSEFYSCLERIGQLESATSMSDLRPVRKNEDIIDYDLWRKVREYEKNERELNHLVRKVRGEQKEKDFIYEPHTADEVRWQLESDLGLITKEKSVENLRELFYKKALQEEEEKSLEVEANKDNYKPLWRGNSVLDLATTMTLKYNTDTPKATSKVYATLPKKDSKNERKFGISKTLLSTLSKDQLSKIKNQLTEIYSSGNLSGENSPPNDIEKYVVTVPMKDSSNNDQLEKSFLTVRSHSLLTKEQVQEPAIDISTLMNVFESKESPKRSPKPECPPISESHKKMISQSLCQEIKDKFAQQKKNNPDIERVKRTLHDNVISKTLPLPKKPKKDISFSFNEPKPLIYVELAKPSTSLQDFESISSETSNRTVIFREPATVESVKSKIQYFEEKQKETPPKTIYHARDDSSPDEDESAKIAEKSIMRHRSQSPYEKPSLSKSPRLSSSQSFTDLKDFFGEKTSLKLRKQNNSGDVAISNASLTELQCDKLDVPANTQSCRSRSSSPESERCTKSLIEFGDVYKIKSKFESVRDEPVALSFILSDSDINKSSELRKSIQRVRIRGHEFGNVSRITHKYELQSARARSRTRRIRVVSPILKHPLKKDDRFMPHINVISKTASLKDQHQRISQISTSNRDSLNHVEPLATGEVAKITQKFETQSNLSLIGKCFTSEPDFRELNDISAHLSNDWIAHLWPNPSDNSRSLSSPDQGAGTVVRKRGDSRKKRTSSLSPVAQQFQDIFKDQNFDPEKHRPRHRYVPDKQQGEWRKLGQKQSKLKTNNSVSFKGC